MATIIPIIRIKKLIDSLLEYIITDWNDNYTSGTESESFLYQVLSGNNESGFDFYEQGKAIFLRDQTKQRKIKTVLMFTKDIAESPTIMITEPAKTDGGYDAIGGLNGEKIYLTNSFKDNYRSSVKSDFELVITSQNPAETILISEIIYNLLLAAYETINSVLEFDLVKFGMKELMANSELVPYALYIKSITIDCSYEVQVPSIQKDTLLNSIRFEKPTIES